MRLNYILSLLVLLLWSINSILTIVGLVLYSDRYGIHLLFAMVFFLIGLFIYKKNILLHNEVELIKNNKNLKSFIKYEIVILLFILFIAIVTMTAIVSRLFYEHFSLFD